MNCSSTSLEKTDTLDSFDSSPSVYDEKCGFHSIYQNTYMTKRSKILSSSSSEVSHGTCELRLLKSTSSGETDTEEGECFCYGPCGNGDMDIILGCSCVVHYDCVARRTG